MGLISHYFMLFQHTVHSIMQAPYRIRECGNILYLGMAQEVWDFANLAMA